jgi:hypothetical protein
MRLLHERILYYFDGPQIFSARMGFIDAIFVKIDEEDDRYFFLSATTTDEIISLVQDNKLSVRGAFLRDNLFVVETDYNYEVKRYWTTSRDQITEDMLPRAGVALAPRHGRLPDTVEQAKAFFSVAFRGNAFSTSRMPFSALKDLVDGAYDLTRKVLTPTSIVGRRSSTFDLVVEPTIGSLIISIERPELKLSRINRNLESPLTYDLLNSEIVEQRARFLDVLERASEGETYKSGSDDSGIDILREYIGVIPNEDSLFSSVEFSATVDREVRTVFIDSETGERIHEAIRGGRTERAVRSGRIVEINSTSRTFLIEGRNKRVTTCVASDAVFRDPELKINNHADLTGDLIRRRRRDLLYVATYRFRST